MHSSVTGGLSTAVSSQSTVLCRQEILVCVCVYERVHICVIVCAHACACVYGCVCVHYLHGKWPGQLSPCSSTAMRSEYTVSTIHSSSPCNTAVHSSPCLTKAEPQAQTPPFAHSASHQLPCHRHLVNGCGKEADASRPILIHFLNAYIFMRFLEAKSNTCREASHLVFQFRGSVQRFFAHSLQIQ